MGPANRLVSLPLPVGESSNACSAKFDLGVGDEVANEENPINLCMRCSVAQDLRPSLALGLVCRKVGRASVCRVLGESPSGVGVTV